MRHREPLPAPDPRLDRYRRRAGVLWDGTTVAGYLITRVDTWWQVERHLLRRREVRPEERVEWFIDFAPDFDIAHPDGWDDGVSAEPAELDTDQFSYKGRLLRVVWLDGQQADEHLAAHGW